MKILGDNYNQYSKINKNHALEQNQLQNHKMLKTGSTQTHSKSKNN